MLDVGFPGRCVDNTVAYGFWGNGWRAPSRAIAGLSNDRPPDLIGELGERKQRPLDEPSQCIFARRWFRRLLGSRPRRSGGRREEFLVLQGERALERLPSLLESALRCPLAPRLHHDRSLRLAARLTPFPARFFFCFPAFPPSIDRSGRSNRSRGFAIAAWETFLE